MKRGAIGAQMSYQFMGPRLNGSLYRLALTLQEPQQKAQPKTRDGRRNKSLVSDDQVREMRRMYDGGTPSRLIAKKFGLDAIYAWNICVGNTHSKVTP